MECRTCYPCHCPLLLGSNFLISELYHRAQVGIKAIHTLEMQKHVMLASAMSLQHLKHSWLEVVVDGDAGHPSPKLKGMALAQQKGILPLGREAFHKHRPRKAEPPGQERHFDQLTTQFDGRFAKVTLCSLPR